MVQYQNQSRNLILDFSHVYEEDGVMERLPGLTRIDCSDVPGTDMYCSEEGRDIIERKLAEYGPQGIHFIDNGNYHYVTAFFAEKIQRPYILFLFDHHTDMQKPMIHDLLSCGSWAGELLRRDSYLKQLVLTGPNKSQLRDLPADLRARVLCISMQELENEEARTELARVREDLPVYISIDKDVLDRMSARTNWNQGNMSLKMLLDLTEGIFRHAEVIGVDICGENSLLEPASELAEDLRINEKTDEILYRALSRWIKKKH